MGYKTIKDFAKAEFIEKKSRFIGHIMPVKTEKDATEFIQKISKEHYSATHNVYAYVLREGQKARFSDNGEPQGTAGVPVLDVIQKEGLTDVCVVVTRYFGGIMLGAGGLVRAYSHSAKIAVDAASILNMQDCTEFLVDCDYSSYGKIKKLFEKYNVTEKESDFQEIIRLTLIIKSEQFCAFETDLTELSNGKLKTYNPKNIFFDIK